MKFARILFLLSFLLTFCSAGGSYYTYRNSRLHVAVNVNSFYATGIPTAMTSTTSLYKMPVDAAGFARAIEDPLPYGTAVVSNIVFPIVIAVIGFLCALVFAFVRCCTCCRHCMCCQCCCRGDRATGTYEKKHQLIVRLSLAVSSLIGVIGCIICMFGMSVSGTVDHVIGTAETVSTDAISNMWEQATYVQKVVNLESFVQPIDTLAKGAVTSVQSITAFPALLNAATPVIDDVAAVAAEALGVVERLAFHPALHCTEYIAKYDAAGTDMTAEHSLALVSWLVANDKMPTLAGECEIDRTQPGCFSGVSDADKEEFCNDAANAAHCTGTTLIADRMANLFVAPAPAAAYPSVNDYCTGLADATGACQATLCAVPLLTEGLANTILETSRTATADVAGYLAIKDLSRTFLNAITKMTELASLSTIYGVNETAKDALNTARTTLVGVTSTLPGTVDSALGAAATSASGMLDGVKNAVDSIGGFVTPAIRDMIKITVPDISAQIKTIAGDASPLWAAAAWAVGEYNLLPDPLNPGQFLPLDIPALIDAYVFGQMVLPKNLCLYGLDAAVNDAACPATFPDPDPSTGLYDPADYDIIIESVVTVLSVDGQLLLSIAPVVTLANDAAAAAKAYIYGGCTVAQDPCPADKEVQGVMTQVNSVVPLSVDAIFPLLYLTAFVFVFLPLILAAAFNWRKWLTFYLWVAILVTLLMSVFMALYAALASISSESCVILDVVSSDPENVVIDGFAAYQKLMANISGTASPDNSTLNTTITVVPGYDIVLPLGDWIDHPENERSVHIIDNTGLAAVLESVYPATTIDATITDGKVYYKELLDRVDSTFSVDIKLADINFADILHGHNSNIFRLFGLHNIINQVITLLKNDQIGAELGAIVHKMPLINDLIMQVPADYVKLAGTVVDQSAWSALAALNGSAIGDQAMAILAMVAPIGGMLDQIDGIAGSIDIGNAVDLSVVLKTGVAHMSDAWIEVAPKAIEVLTRDGTTYSILAAAGANLNDASYNGVYNTGCGDTADAAGCSHLPSDTTEKQKIKEYCAKDGLKKARDDIATGVAAYEAAEAAAAANGLDPVAVPEELKTAIAAYNTLVIGYPVTCISSDVLAADESAFKMKTTDTTTTVDVTFNVPAAGPALGTTTPITSHVSTIVKDAIAPATTADGISDKRWAEIIEACYGSTTAPASCTVDAANRSEASIGQLLLTATSILTKGAKEWSCDTEPIDHSVNLTDTVTTLKLDFKVCTANGATFATPGAAVLVAIDDGTTTYPDPASPALTAPSGILSPVPAENVAGKWVTEVSTLTSTVVGLLDAVTKLGAGESSVVGVLDKQVLGNLGVTVDWTTGTLAKDTDATKLVSTVKGIYKDVAVPLVGLVETAVSPLLAEENHFVLPVVASVYETVVDNGLCGGLLWTSSYNMFVGHVMIAIGFFFGLIIAFFGAKRLGNDYQTGHPKSGSSVVAVGTRNERVSELSPAGANTGDFWA